MIRKGTWIVLVVFIVLLGGALYLNQHPIPQVNAGASTPLPTAPPALLEGWQAADITSMDIKGDAGDLGLVQSVDGGWKLIPDSTRPVNAGQVENLRSQLATLRPDLALDTGISLADLGLVTPTNILTVQNKAGQKVVIRIGKLTPTGSGYYAQVGSNTPVVINKSAMDAVLGLLKKDQLVAVTPTPLVSPTPETTATPDGTPEPTTTATP